MEKRQFFGYTQKIYQDDKSMIVFDDEQFIISLDLEKKDQDFLDALNLIMGKNQDQNNINRAIELYEKSSNNGSMYSMNNLGVLYADEQYIPSDIKKAIRYFKKAQEMGNSAASFNLGLLYLDGKGITKNLKKGVENMDKAAQSGIDMANFRLGKFYFFMGGKTNVQKSIDYFEVIAKKGNTGACFCLGDIYTRNPDFINFKKAIEYLEVAAEDNHGFAIFLMSSIYLQGGDGIEEDHNKSMKYLQQAADLDIPEAKNMLNIFNNPNDIDIQSFQEKSLSNFAEHQKQISQYYVDTINFCANCKSTENLKYCSRCKKVRYCKRECQVQHWATHKNDCK